VEGYPSPLNPEVEQHLYRITQEALTNVARHAQAKKVIVALNFAPQAVTLIIRDDGIGLNGHTPPSNGTDPTARQGFGLVSIQQRAGLMQGQVTFDLPEAGGTEIKVVIPR
jgi:signal transduction histidine kinase